MIKKEDENKNDSDGDKDDEDEIDFDSSQITENYGALWANERLIIELVNVLSSLNRWIKSSFIKSWMGRW